MKNYKVLNLMKHYLKKDLTNVLLAVCAPLALGYPRSSALLSLARTTHQHHTQLAASSGPDGFRNQEEYLTYLASVSDLPQGFSVGTSRFMFKPFEVQKTLPMNVTVIVADKPSTSFAAMFTSNQFPGGPIIVGKERLKSSKTLQGIVVNNKISNVMPGGSADRGAGKRFWKELCVRVPNTSLCLNHCTRALTLLLWSPTILYLHTVPVRFDVPRGALFNIHASAYQATAKPFARRRPRR